MKPLQRMIKVTVCLVMTGLIVRMLVPMTARAEDAQVQADSRNHRDGMEGATANNDPNKGEIIGRILCRATTVDPDPSHPFGTFVTELYSWPDDVSNLLADGIGPNLGFTSHRIVSGGTGRFRNMIGEIEEKEIGINNTGGCNLRVTFKLTKADAADQGR